MIINVWPYFPPKQRLGHAGVTLQAAFPVSSSSSNSSSSRSFSVLQAVHVYPRNLHNPFLLHLTPWILRQWSCLPISFQTCNDYSTKMNDRGKQAVERCHLYYFEHYEGLEEVKTIFIDSATLKLFKS